MSNSTISTLASGAPAQAGDAIPIARSGSNFKLLVSDIVTRLPGVTNLSTVAFSATPVFNGTAVGAFKITLTGNVTSSTATNLVVGVLYTFIIKQDATGGRTFVWPTSFVGAMVIDGTASITNVQQFVYDGTSLYAVSAGVSM